MLMERYHDLIESFVQQNKLILGDNLVGIYLHGSAVMGCFNPEKSDIDLIIVVENSLSDEAKRKYMDMVVEHNRKAPAKGLELSIVKESVCDPFIYPTPYELHFSNAYLEQYRQDPDEYIKKMKGEDTDLAAHFTVIRHRGKVLCGEEIDKVFPYVDKKYYLNSIWLDVKDAASRIAENPAYYILNLSRVLAFAKEGLILSKAEGGEWGLQNIAGKFRYLVSSALEEYQANSEFSPDKMLMAEFADHITARIIDAVCNNY